MRVKDRVEVSWTKMYPMVGGDAALRTSHSNRQLREQLVEGHAPNPAAETVQRRADWWPMLVATITGVVSAAPIAAAAQELLVVRPTDLVFNAVEGGACGASQSVVITSSTGESVAWQVTSSAPWLQVSATSGTTPDEVTGFVDCNGLAPGVHEATLDVSGADGSVAVTANLIVNPASRVKLSPWKDGRRGALSFSIDDGYAAGYTELSSNGVGGTFVMNGTTPPPYYADMFDDGHELGAHLVSHYCYEVDEPTLRFEIEANFAGVEAATQSADDVVSLVWPCGFNTLAAQAVAAEYFLSARGYNINELEETTPANFMNLKSFNSHEHTPFPPADLKSVVDAAEAQGKWANLVLHAFTNDDGAIAYSKLKDLWRAPIGDVVKYILLRDRTRVTQYSETSSAISFTFSRLAIAPSALRNFETTIKPTDQVTFRVDLAGIAFVADVTVAGSAVPFQVKNEGGKRILYFSSPVTADARTAVIGLSSVVPPILEVSATSLEFAANQDDAAPGQALQIENNGAGTLGWTATVGGSGPNWLVVNPTSGAGTGTVNVSVNPEGLAEGRYTRTITIAAAGAYGAPRTVPVALVVNPAGAQSYILRHADRASLLAAGWNFLARTPNNNVRNTEHTNGASVVYGPGSLRVATDVGDLWEGFNNTRNSLFRDLPSNWKSVRVRLDFAPTRGYQQAGLVVYENDDNYVQVTRMYEGDQAVVFARETGGAGAVIAAVPESATSNVYLRLDRDSTTGVITGSYSLNGSAWTALGSVNQTISAPRLGLIATGLDPQEISWVAGAPPDGFPDATFHIVQVIEDAPLTTPALTLNTTSLDLSAEEGASVPPQAIAIGNTGAGTLEWTAAVTGGSQWLSVSPASGVGNGTISVSLTSAGLAAGSYSGQITVTASGATNSPQTVPVVLIVSPTPGDAGNGTYNLTYSSRDGFLADGWDFLARTSGGGVRDTEQTDGATVSYSATGMRVPADSGDLWEALNSTRNSVFRDLPSQWTSVRVRLDFAPTQNTQQAGLVVYEDDDNYVQVTRVFAGGQAISFVHEAGGVATVPASAPVAATTNVYLRLDRDVATDVIAGSYSLDGGNTWQALGSVSQVIDSPRLGLIVGASPGGYPEVVFHTVNIYAQSSPAGLSLDTTSLSFAAQEGGGAPARTISVANSGSESFAWTASVGGNGPNWLNVSPSAGVAPGDLTVSVNTTGVPVGVHTRTITVTAPEAINSPRVVTVTLTVYPSDEEGQQTYAFDYLNRASLIADGWDFLAETAGGATRNTETTTGAVVSYDPGARVLRIPADAGDLWETLNSTRNSLFRDLPTTWTSVRVLLDFAPTRNYQQAGLVVYDNDDNYVHLTRIFNGGQRIIFAREAAGSGAVLSMAPTTATSNLFLRLDRNNANGTIAALYSLDGGQTWESLGSVGQTVSTPRLGLIVGASPDGFPQAAFRVVQVFADTAPTLSLSTTSLSFVATEGQFVSPQAIQVENPGAGALDWAAAVDGSGSNWLSVSPGSGSGAGVINVSANAAGLPVGTYARTITVAAAGANESPQTVDVTLVVTPAASGMSYQMTYADATSLHTDGWDFLARTADGTSRNTEQSNGSVVIYDAFGPLRVPADVGDLWSGLNDTRNSLFRALPVNWTSVWVKLDFAPTQNTQQAGLVVYENDDNYVQVMRTYEDGQSITFVREIGGAATVLAAAPVAATTNLFLRIDRDIATDVLTGRFSLNGGLSWQTLGNVTQTLANVRLGLIVGASPAGAPQAAFHVVQVQTDETPTLTLSTTDLNLAVSESGTVADQTIAVESSGESPPVWTATVDAAGGPNWLSVSPIAGSGAGTVTVSIDNTGLEPGIYTRSITVEAPGAANSPQAVSVTLVVTPAGAATHYLLSYPNRASLLQDGWDFLARTASGSSRNTEQTNGATVGYDSSGRLLVPADSGDLWEGLNDTRNSVFRDLPAEWTSVRVLVDFAPTQNFQQAGLVVYDNDDNYVHVARMFNGSQLIVLAREINGSGSLAGLDAVTATTGLLLRLDRDAATEAISGRYSVDGGSTWWTLGGVTQTFDSPRLGLIVGASPDGFPDAYFHRVDVWVQ